MIRYVTPCISTIRTPKKYMVQFISNARGLSYHTTGVHLAILDTKNQVSLHYISRSETMFNEHSVDAVEIVGNLVNANTIWLAPDDDGRWDLKSVVVSDEQHDVCHFDANVSFSGGIQLSSAPNVSTARNNDDYVEFQKASMDKQLALSCITTVACALIDPDYAVCFLLSSTVGTIYLFLLEKQVETLGNSPITSLISYQARMIIVNGFLIYSFTEYSKTNDISYLLVSAIGFFLYRITLVLSQLSI
jgi:hypothetical protein